MSSKTFAGALCLTFGLTGALAAQSPTQNPTQQPRTNDMTAAQHTVTVEGCLVRESDVPGRAPNPAERAGVMEDFILANAKIVKGGHTTPDAATGTTGAPPTGEAAGTSGKTLMFEVRGLQKDELQPFIGQRVEIEGKVDPNDLPEYKKEKANPSGEPAGDLPELTGVVIRKSTSTTPCTPMK